MGWPSRLVAAPRGATSPGQREVPSQCTARSAAQCAQPVARSRSRCLAEPRRGRPLQFGISCTARSDIDIERKIRGTCERGEGENTGRRAGRSRERGRGVGREMHSPLPFVACLARFQCPLDAGPGGAGRDAAPSSDSIPVPRAAVLSLSLSLSPFFHRRAAIGRRAARRGRSQAAKPAQRGACGACGACRTCGACREHQRSLDSKAGLGPQETRSPCRTGRDVAYSVACAACAVIPRVRPGHRDQGRDTSPPRPACWAASGCQWLPAFLAF